MASTSARPRRTLEQTVFLQLQKTADDLMAEFAELIKPYDLSPQQYNVLRILRAAGDAGLASGKITERMLTREPDMTRLLDRLEKRDLIRRDRDMLDSECPASTSLRPASNRARRRSSGRKRSTKRCKNWNSWRAVSRSWRRRSRISRLSSSAGSRKCCVARRKS